MVLGLKHVGACVKKFYKFYICAEVGVIIGQLDNMHGVTMKICYIVILADNKLLPPPIIQVWNTLK